MYNGKQAVKDVLDGRMPAYIPLGTYAIDCDTVERIIGHKTYVRNKYESQLAFWDGRRDEVAQSWREDSIELFRRLDGIDLIIPYKEGGYLPPADYVPPKVKKLSDTLYETDDGAVYGYSLQSNDIILLRQPPVNTGIFYGERRFQKPDPSCAEAMDALTDAFSGERYIAGLSGGINALVLLGGMEEGLMEYYLNPDDVRAAGAYYEERQNFLDQYLIHDCYDGVFLEEDYADSNATLISPEMFQDFCAPTLIRRVRHVKKFKEQVMFHCCGNTRGILDVFKEAGVNCYQSLQTNAGMDLVELSEEHGNKMRFWGGVSVEILISGTMEEVRAQVRRAFQLAKRGIPFILGPSHSIAYGVCYDNFMALLDEHDRLKSAW